METIRRPLEAERRRVKMAQRSKLYGVVLAASVAWAIAGCAGSTPMSSGGTVKAVTASDMALLAGTWQGTMSGATGNSFPATVTVKPDGTYLLQGGPFYSQGQAAIKDGRIDLVASGGGTGRGDPTMQVTERTASAVLMDEGTNWAVVGTGRSNTGPYNFA